MNGRRRRARSSGAQKGQPDDIFIPLWPAVFIIIIIIIAFYMWHYIDGHNVQNGVHKEYRQALLSFHTFLIKKEKKNTLGWTRAALFAYCNRLNMIAAAATAAVAPDGRPQCN